MLNFFRKIRLHLINQASSDKDRKGVMSERSTKKTSSPIGRYLLYAIGEIFLVMIGILLALQVNNWNQKRLDDIKEKNMLSAIYEEMRQLDFFQENAFESYSQVMQSAEAILIVINDPSLPLNKKLLDENLNMISNRRWLTGASNVTNIYDLLIGSGQWELLSSKELRGNLKMLNSHLEFLLAFEELQANFVDNQLSPFLNQYIDRISISPKHFELSASLLDNRFETSYSELLDSQGFSNLLVELKRHTYVLVNTYRRIGHQIAAIDSITIAGNPSIKIQMAN